MSYNVYLHFNSHFRDAIAVSLGNCLTSVFAGFVIFSYLGNLSHVLGVPIEDVAKSGPSLAFIVYPYAVTLLPAAPFWSIIFFLMLITLGVDSEVSILLKYFKYYFPSSTSKINASVLLKYLPVVTFEKKMLS